jgi:hypothetical protein
VVGDAGEAAPPGAEPVASGVVVNVTVVRDSARPTASVGPMRLTV